MTTPAPTCTLAAARKNLDRALERALSELEEVQRYIEPLKDARRLLGTLTDPRKRPLQDCLSFVEELTRTARDAGSSTSELHHTVGEYLWGAVADVGEELLWCDTPSPAPILTLEEDEG